MKRWTKDAKKDSVVCDHAKLADANDELSMTSRRNELMHLVYEIFIRSATTTGHTEMCKRKIREMIELVEKDMEELSVARDDGERENSFVNNTISGDVEKTNCPLNNSPILDPPCVRLKGVTNARIKSNMEKHKRKTLKDITRSKQLPTRGLSANSGNVREVATNSQISTYAPQCTSLCQPMHPSSVPMDENYNNQIPFSY